MEQGVVRVGRVFEANRHKRRLASEGGPRRLGPSTHYSSSRPSEGLAGEPAKAVSNWGISSSAIGVSGNKWRGRKNALAIIVGMTALAITAATKKEYCSGLTNSCVSPYKADIVPHVNPVDIKSV